MINRMNDEQPDSAVAQTYHLPNYDSSTTYYKRRKKCTHQVVLVRQSTNVIDQLGNTPK